MRNPSKKTLKRLVRAKDFARVNYISYSIAQRINVVQILNGFIISYDIQKISKGKISIVKDTGCDRYRRKAKRRIVSSKLVINNFEKIISEVNEILDRSNVASVGIGRIAESLSQAVSHGVVVTKLLKEIV